MPIIGHRGACGYEPENTLASFKKALDLGVDMIELDVHVLASGELVVIHDHMVNRTTNGTGYLTDFTFEDLRALDAGNGQQVPTLSEVIDLVDRQIPINIELKGHGTAKPVAALLDGYLARGWSSEDFLISSFNHVELAEFHKLHPTIKLGALLSTIPVDYAAFAENLGAYSMNPDAGCICAELVEDAHNRGLKVFVHTVNEQSEIERMRSLHVDGIFTNFPDIARTHLA